MKYLDHNQLENTNHMLPTWKYMYMCIGFFDKKVRIISIKKHFLTHQFSQKIDQSSKIWKQLAKWLNSLLIFQNIAVAIKCEGTFAWGVQNYWKIAVFKHAFWFNISKS